MFRTRDFVLVFTTVAFLLVAISYSVFRPHSDTQSAEALGIVDNEITTVTAEVIETETNAVSRAERLAKMQEKIRSSQLIGISEPNDNAEAVLQEVTATTTPSFVSEPILCPNYTDNLAVNWPIEEIETESVEGVRQYFIEQEFTVGTSSSSTITKQVLLALPSNFLPFGQPNCLPTDVVGVALDGSLIRNDELALYGIFTDQTLLGYALDGYPIYGVGSEEVDNCGGRIELGQYRYELSNERQTILRCFAGQPQTFSR